MHTCNRCEADCSCDHPGEGCEHLCLQLGDEQIGPLISVQFEYLNTRVSALCGCGSSFEGVTHGGDDAGYALWYRTHACALRDPILIDQKK